MTIVLFILKGLGIIGCIMLLIIKWCVVMPVWGLTVTLPTGYFLNEFDFAILPETWFYNLTHQEQI